MSPVYIYTFISYNFDLFLIISFNLDVLETYAAWA